MGSCVICGTSVEGHVCESHREDVAFEFEGSRANQLTPGRFYRGEVDGFADFGVFIDIGDSVTGLLHRSELDRRLESLDWDAGDSIYVQVTDVHDNGNVDLAWSIRQEKREFRGALVDDPEGDRLHDAEGRESAADGAGVEDPNEHAAATTGVGADTDVRTDPQREAEPTVRTDAESTAEADSTTETEDAANAATRATATTNTEPAGATDAAEVTDAADATDASDTADTTDTSASATGTEGADDTLAEPDAERERAAIGSLESRVGDAVRIEGQVAGVRQTGGPTVFEVTDESGTVECAAFEAAGVRAYPDVEVGDAVRINGEVERHRDALQIETDGLAILTGEERTAVEQRLEDAVADRAEPDPIDALADDPAVEAVIEDVREVAGAIRRAVIESRPVVVRHAATADGYVAGAAIERAVLALLDEEHAGSDAAYHYFDRRPVEGSVYGMDDATKDTTRMLDDRERHGEALPLFVFAAAGSTRESADGLELLSVYGAKRAVIDSVDTDPEIEPAVDASVTATESNTDDGTDIGRPTATTLAANVAAHVDPDVRGDLGHLPAVSYWDEPPRRYVDLADEAGDGAAATRNAREAIALLAHYHSYQDKRELVSDVLFGDEGAEPLAAQLASQFERGVERELDTADANLSGRAVGEVQFTVLDADAFTHGYEFPPTELLIDELHRRTREDAAVTIAVGEDDLHLRSTEPLDVRQVAERAGERAPDAGLSAQDARDGRIGFLVGEREAALEAVIQAVVSTFGPHG